MEILRLKKESYIYIHPITKIITFFSCSFIMMSSGERLVENLILCLLLILLLKAKFYKLFIKIFILCSFLACTEFAILKLQMPVIILSLIKFVKIFIPIIISYYLLAKGTTGLELMTALNDFKFPKSFTIPVIVMIRFIPTVVDSIRDTEKSLGIKGFVKKRIIKHPIMSSEYILVPVLMTCLNSMDELAQASLARDFSLNQKRENVLKLYFSIFDIAIILFFIAMLLHKRWI